MLSGNYRPLTLTSNISKLIEHLINYRLRMKLSEQNLYDITQEGSIPKKGTLRYLYRLIMRRKMTFNNYAISILCDLNKAYDSIWLNGLLFRL